MEEHNATFGICEECGKEEVRLTETILGWICDECMGSEEDRL